MGQDAESGERRPLLSAKRVTSSASSNGHGRRSSARSRHPKASIFVVTLCTAVVALGPITFGFSLGFTSPTQEQITHDLSLSVSQFSMYGSLVNLGAMFGAALSGRIADRIGRRGALAVASVPHILGWIANATAMSVAYLYIARLLVGFGVGVISFTVPMYIAEIAPKEYRGSLGTVNQLAVTIGIFLSYLGGLFLQWRSLAFAGVIPCGIMLAFLPFISESPRWLAKKGYEDSLISSLRVLRGRDYDISTEVSNIQDAVEIAQKHEANVRFADLFSKSLMRPLIIGIGLQVFQQLGGVNAIMFYSSNIFSSAGFTSSNLASFSLSTLQVVSTGVAAVLMDKAGRRLLLMISAAGMAVTCFLVSVSFYLSDSSPHAAFTGVLSLMSLLVYIVSFSLGMGPIPWIIMSEIFPTHVRGVAGSIATMTNWTCCWIVTMTFNFLLDWSSVGSFLIFSAVCFATVLFVKLLVPETRGKTLEEIEELFK